MEVVTTDNSNDTVVPIFLDTSMDFGTQLFFYTVWYDIAHEHVLLYKVQYCIIYVVLDSRVIVDTSINE